MIEEQVLIADILSIKNPIDMPNLLLRGRLQLRDERRIHKRMIDVIKILIFLTIDYLINYTPFPSILLYRLTKSSLILLIRRLMPRLGRQIDCLKMLHKSQLRIEVRIRNRS